MIRCRKADPWMAFELILREEDAREVSDDWRVKLAESIRVDGGLAFYDEVGLVALGGVVTSPVTVSPWLLCSDRVSAHKAGVWRRAKRAVASIRHMAGNRLVYNHIPKNSPRNRAFVQALGFVILPSPRDGFDTFFLPCVNPQP